MGIYFNGKLLEAKAEGSPLQKRFHDELQEIDRLFQRFKKPGGGEPYLLFSRNFVKVYNRSRTSYKPAPPMAISLKGQINDPQVGSVQIRYSETPPEVTDNNKLIWPSNKNKSIIGEMLSVYPKDRDYAWFIIKVSQLIERGALTLVDKDREFKGKFSDIQKQLAASKTIFDDDLSMESIQAIADAVLPKSMSISGETKEELATQLWDIVMKGEETKQSYNYDALIKASNKLQALKAKDKANNMKDNPSLAVVNLSDGSSITVPFINCPPPTKEETLERRATECGFSTEGLSRDEIYSVIRFKEAEVHE